MKYQAVICSLLLWPCLALSVSHYGKSLHKWKWNRGNGFKKDEIDPVVVTDGDQSLGGIEADSLGENSQITFNTNADKETVMHELDYGGPVFNHDVNAPSTAKETTNDMSNYESEEINLVGNSHHKDVKTKPVRLPSLTKEGKVDTFLPKLKLTDENDSLKIIKPNKRKSSPSNKGHLSTRNNNQTDSSQAKATSKTKNSEHRSLKVPNTEHHSFTSESGSSNIFDVPDINLSDDDDILPKSSKLLLGESDDSSPEKLRKSGERLTMFYDRDSRFKKKQSVAHKQASKPEKLATDTINVKGGQIVGGKISGGNIFGGDIEGGLIDGGTIKGGIVKGGRITKGLMDGGLLLDGDIAGGFLHNGTVRGGVIRGGNITGGTVTGGEILGGHLSSGFVAGGVLKKGGVEGGVLKGGIIDGGILKGGVMESGKLLGGIVLNGRVTGGTILGGEVLGGEVGEGVVIKGGRINGTVTIGRKSGFKTPGNGLGSLRLFPLARLLNQNQLRLHNQSSLHYQPSQQNRVGPQYQQNRVGPQYQQNRVGPQYNPNLHKVVTLHGAARPQSLLSSQNTIEGDVGGRVNARPFIPQSIPVGHLNGVSSGNIANDAVVINKKTTPNVLMLSNISKEQEQIKRNHQPNGFYNRPQYSNYVSPNNPYSTSSYGYQATTQYQSINSYPNPLTTSVQTPQQNGININQFVKQVANGARSVQRSSTAEDKGDVKPTHHWILNEIKNGVVTGVPSGRKFVAKGGIRLNRASIGFDGTATFMDGGSYAGTCVSDPSLCPRGLSFEMTIKVDPTATMYRAPRYILDSGASSFDSRGVALYTMDNKLRADVAIKDKAYCVVAPLVTNKWQDVVLTYHKDGELNMYINCKLVATTENDDQCISCHTSGCHSTDSNTKLVLGRANNDPQSNFARFKAGDLSIYERFLNPQDINKICGLSKPQKPNSQTANYMQVNPSWSSPVLSSYPRTQPGFLKSAIFGQQRKSQNVINAPSAQKKTQSALNVPYFSPWGSWTICSTSCGLGTKTRQRSCIYTHAQSGWQTCHGVTFQAQKCSSNCPAVRQHVQANTQTGTRKDAQPAAKINLANEAHLKITKPAITRTNLNKWINGASGKQKKGKKKNTKDITAARRNKISKILSKLGNLLGTLDK